MNLTRRERVLVDALAVADGALCEVRPGDYGCWRRETVEALIERKILRPASFAPTCWTLNVALYPELRQLIEERRVAPWS